MHRRIALVLHGRIGIWRTRSSHIDDAKVVWLANAPQAWKRAPPTMAGIDRKAHSTLAGFAAFGRASLWKYVVEPNRASGATLDIFLHSWHEEIGSALDAMYMPVGSKHELVKRRLNSVQSQHLSMKTGLELMSAQEAKVGLSYQLVLVTRYDILYFTPLLLGELDRAPLWLPNWCHRYPLTAQSGMIVRSACGNWPGHGEGYLVHPATCQGVDPKIRRSVTREADFDYAYLDWWLVATPAIARSFGDIYDNFGRYTTALRRIAEFKPWSHFYWGYHINRVLRMRRAVRFVLYEGVDFRLARHWHFGTHCMHFVGGASDTAGPAASALALDPADANARSAGAAAAKEADRTSKLAASLADASFSRKDAPATTLKASALAAAHAAERAVTESAIKESAIPGSAVDVMSAVGIDTSVYYRRWPKARHGSNETRQEAQLARQCPFDARVRLYCPWHSPVCPSRFRQAVLDAEAAAHFAINATSTLPLWNLYNEVEARQARAVEQQVGHASA
jgi:hypothetical protein